MYLGGQVKKPTRFVGRIFASLMNVTHSEMTDWALAFVSIKATATALDVGCGGGQTVKKLAAMATQVYGIDYAAGSLAASAAHNQELITAGRVTIEKASVSKLPFPDDSFDIVTAVETQYYWPDIPSDLQEILRVMKPGGEFVVVLESYRGGKNDWLLGPVMRMSGAPRLSVAEQRELFAMAGYVNVRTIEEVSRGWLCVIGCKAR